MRELPPNSYAARGLSIPSRRDGRETIALATATKSVPVQTPTQDTSFIATVRKARDSGASQAAYLATTVDVARIQAAMRAAERGDTWQFFTIVRDMISSYGHLTAEWNKRKMVIVGQPMNLIPSDPGNADDVVACDVIREAIEYCRNWQEGLQHLLDATLMPLSVAEKIFEPIGMAEGSQYRFLKRMRLKEIAPVNYANLCFKIPYLPSGNRSNPATIFNADEWESWLRFYNTTPTGAINYGTLDVYAPDPNIHVIHRGNLLSPSIPPNFGGHIRTILFHWLLTIQDRDWWALMMNKYGLPIPVAKADAQQKDTVQQLQAALALGTQLGGIVIDKMAELEWSPSPGTDGSNAHKIFSDYHNCEVSKIVVGQVLSSTPKNTGLGSGMADQAEGVRDDIRMWDTLKLSDTLQKQLFPQILAVNGYRGKSPKISWGGIKMGESDMFAGTLQKFSSAGYELTDAGIIAAAEKVGYGLQRKPEPKVAPGGFGDGNE